MDKRLEKIIKEAFSLEGENIEESWTSDDIPAWDSLGHLNLMVAIEKEFKIKFEIEEMFQMKNLGEINNLVQKKLGLVSPDEKLDQEIKKCPVCQNKELSLVFRVPKFPYIGFSIYPEEKQKILERYSMEDLIAPLKIVSCSHCGHLSQAIKPNKDIMDTIYGEIYNYPSPMLYGFAQEREKFFLKMFFGEVWPILRQRKLENVLEIACFDGFILRELSRKGFQVTGCDPSKGADIAKKFGLKVYKEYFRSDDFIRRGEFFDIIIFRNFLEHVADPIEFLKEVAKILTKKGLIIFETPNIEYYLENGAFESFNFQHLQHFSLISVNKALRSADFKLIKYQFTPEDMIIVAGREGQPCSLERSSIGSVIRLADNFARTFGANVKRFQLYFAPFLAQNKKIVLWGAGGFCGYFFTLHGVDKNSISYLVDVDPRKWEMRFLDKDLKIYSPEKLLADSVDLIIITSMYTREILAEIERMKIEADVISLHPQVEYLKR